MSEDQMRMPDASTHIFCIYWVHVPVPTGAARSLVHDVEHNAHGGRRKCIATDLKPFQVVRNADHVATFSTRWNR